MKSAITFTSMISRPLVADNIDGLPSHAFGTHRAVSFSAKEALRTTHAHADVGGVQRPVVLLVLPPFHCCAF